MQTSIRMVTFSKETALAGSKKKLAGFDRTN
jgi:hypothetical protein